MTIAEQYRERHRELKRKEAEEESWPSTLLNLGAFVVTAMIWLALFMVLVPKI